MIRIARQNLWEGIFITALVLAAIAVISGCSVLRDATANPEIMAPVIAAVPAVIANPADPTSWTTIFTWIGSIAGTALAGWFGVRKLKK